jgi:hypothetical protein
MLYKIIQSTDPQQVVERVNIELQSGWKPLGGIALASWYPHGPVVESIDRWAQALIKEN